MAGERAGALVLFGISGDLAKKLLLPALYRLEAAGLLDEPVIGVARSEWDDDELHRHTKEAIEDAHGSVDDEALSRLLGRMSYVQGEYAETATFDELKKRLGDRAASAVFYLAVPPPLFTTVAEAIAREGLNERSRLVVEKPFGHDLASARALNEELRRFFTDDRLLRVDHFLGKDSLLAVTPLRFANPLLEAAWNARYVESVQITFAEDLDVADRGGFYDGVGALRDVVENHLFQVVAFLAMEQPDSRAAVKHAAERARVMRAVRPLRPDDLVRGQYEGYLEVEGVKPDSKTETFVALRLEIDNDRWRGVPFYLRTGKCLPTDLLEVVVEMKPGPLHEGGERSTVRFRLQPGSGLRAELLANPPGKPEELKPVDVSGDLERELGPVRLAYEAVLAGALEGSSAHFVSWDFVETCWRIVDGILDLDEAPHRYAPGTWGPEAAESLPAGGWLPVDAASGGASGAQ